MATFEFNGNIFIEKIDEKHNSTVITKRTITFRKPIIMQLNSNNKELTISAYVDNQYDAEYLEGLVSYEHPIYINVNNTKYGIFYGVIKGVSVNREQSSFYDIKLDVERINSDYKFIIKSSNELIQNSFIDDTTKQPTITLPTGTKILNSGVDYKTEGVVDVYKTDSIELLEPIPTTNIKIYDDMGTSDETKWKLVSVPEEHEFVGNWVIEQGNIRLKVRDVYLNINGVFTKVGYLYTDVNINNGYISSVGNNYVELTYLMNNNVYDKMKIFFDNETIYTVGNENASKIGQNSDLNISDVYSIYVNSDRIVKTGCRETDYTLNSGSKGWILRLGLKNRDCCVLFSDNANLDYSTTNGYVNIEGKWKHHYLPHLTGKLFNEAERGHIIFGSIIHYNFCSNGYGIYGYGGSLNVVLFRTNNVPRNWSIPSGDYTIIFRIISFSMSLNDSLKLVLHNYTKNVDEVVVIKTAADFGVPSKCCYFNYSYNGTDDIEISVKPNINVDGTRFYIDYAAIVPISEINDLQKRVFTNNNQKLTITPK